MSLITNLFSNPANTLKIRDARHAAKIFIDNNYALAPKSGFLFHVAFDLNPKAKLLPNETQIEVGLMVKSVALPKFTVDQKTLNSYNRPNIVQTKIKYDPVTITFHDDTSNTVNGFWRDYYDYYYRDSDYTNGGDDSYNIGVFGDSQKYKERQKTDWGYTIKRGEDRQYINAIRIYSFAQGNFTEHVLINPTITSFQHGEHRNGDNMLMENTMTIAYEAVQFFTGYTTTDTVVGFIDLHYDQTPSPLTPENIQNLTREPKFMNALGLFSRVTGVGGSLFGPSATYKSYFNNKDAALKSVVVSEANNFILKAIAGKKNPNSPINAPGVSNIITNVYGPRNETNSWANDKYAIKTQTQPLQEAPTNINQFRNAGILLEKTPGVNLNQQGLNTNIISNGSAVGALSRFGFNSTTIPKSGVVSGSQGTVKPSFPLDNANGTSTERVTTYPPAYYMRPINNPPVTGA